MLRRRLLAGGGLLLAAPALRRARAAPAVVEVRLRSDPDGAHVGFDPIGLKVARGTTVRWVVEAEMPRPLGRGSFIFRASHIRLAARGRGVRYRPGMMMGPAKAG